MSEEDTGTLYTFLINLNTQAIETYIDYKYENDFGFMEEEVEYALFDDDGFENIYAESLVSMNKAQTLVYEKCLELEKKFGDCRRTILQEWNKELP